MTEELRQIAGEWLNKPFLKKYSEIGKDWLAKQNKSKETI